MSHNVFLCICVLTFLIMTASGEPYANNTNTCSRIVGYTEVYNSQCQTSYQSPYTTWCGSWPYFGCTRYHTRYRMTGCTKSRPAQRTEYYCCPGYNETVSHECAPICHSSCGNGICSEPDQCLCDIGWIGKNCSTECPDGFWGQDCINKSACVNSAKCNPHDGSCFCTSGWKGEICDEPCDSGYYGQNCTQQCWCNNSGTCEPIYGNCICTPGYIGDSCEKRCPNNYYGIKCNKTCRCTHEAECIFTNGSCICLFGYEGQFCEYRRPKIQRSALIGIICGALMGTLIIAIIVGVVYFRRKQKSDDDPKAKKASSVADDEDHHQGIENDTTDPTDDISSGVDMKTDSGIYAEDETSVAETPKGDAPKNISYSRPSSLYPPSPED